jgi:3-oxoadipate enol-lactonase
MSEVVAVHAVAEGPADAPVVVMSHSLGMTLDMWRPQAEALAREFRVVRYDLRGHGRSPVPPGPYEIADLGADIVALLDRLGVERAHLCGLSLGGMASLWTAAHHPARVARLVACCTSALLGPPAYWAERIGAVHGRGMEAVSEMVVARWFTAPWRARHPERTAEMRAVIAASPPDGYIACCEAIEHMDLRAELGAIRAPTLAIAGAADRSTPPDHLRQIADAIPGARLAIVDDAAHIANLEQPQAVTELIRGHLRGKPERSERDAT